MRNTSIIYPWVNLGDDSIVEDFCVIGALARNQSQEDGAVSIGSGATIRSHTVIYGGNIIGAAFQTGNKVNIRECNTIWDAVSVGTLSVVEHHVTIGNRARIHSQVFIPEYTTIEEDAWIGPNVVFTNALYPVSRGVKERLHGVVVCRGAVVGANATILPGVRIGQNALVGAGSVVTKDVPPGAVEVGNPAKVTKNRSDIEFYEGVNE